MWGKNMKKILPVIIIGMVILSGLEAAAFTVNKSIKPIEYTHKISTSVLFSSQPTVTEKEGFLTVDIDGATTQLLIENTPILPIYVKTYQIPFRSTDIHVCCTVKNLGTMAVAKEIIPAVISSVSELDKQPNYIMDPSIYNSNNFYPRSWWSFDLGAGRNENNQQVTFVKVICYPIRYSPLYHQLQYASSFDITLCYTEPETKQQSTNTDYDMVLIAPEKFESALQPLIDHKNSKGVMTMFKSVEDILAEYDGYDPPEQIKYFIKDAYDTMNITYVTLVGGLKSHIYAKDKDTRSAGYTDWWVPVRYVNIPREYDEGCLSDLYYGCLYNATGMFDSWDSNEDGVYAAWGASGVQNDEFDMYPEVYVSRLPVANVREVKAAVKKITVYESTGPEAKPWYKNFIGIAGKTFYLWNGTTDGQYLCDLAYNYTKNVIPNLQLTTCYATNRDTGGRTPKPKDIIKSFNEGAGFVDFEGHGNTYSWNTIWHDGVYPNDWTGGFNIFLFPLLLNNNKLPVVVVGGCHNGLYNVSLIASYKDRENDNKTYFSPTPSPFCFSAGLVIKPRGGAIASTGCSGYGIGGSGDPANSLSGALESNFFYEIGNDSTHLAQTHSQAIQKYISERNISVSDAYCITEWALFGDASLYFGGYSS
jgi:hypothetical protein